MTEQSTEGRTELGLRELLGGRRGAVDATIPPVAYALGWLLTESVGWGALCAVVAGVAVAIFRLVRGGRIAASVGSVAAVAAAAFIAVRTGRPEDFFVIQVFANIASALAWAVSILVRWPLLGVVVGLLLGQKARWRRDPDLLRAYGRASWVWVLGQYTLRVAVFGYFWWSGWTVALTTVRVALSWPLVGLTVAVSAVVLRRCLPDDHPGLRHPRIPGEETEGTGQPG